ncbi:MAG TPA: ATP-binding protein, partial [Flavipsychrobacter sp.]|nr:ATP-binding protein [Flavipsychrobacter sp.]
KDLAEATKDDEASAYIDKMIGSIYRNQGVLDKGKFYIKESIESFKRLNDSLYLADALSSLGSLYLLEKNYDSAFFCFRRCSELYKRSGNLTNLAYSIENIADVYISIGRTKLHPATDSALFYYRRAYQIFNSLNNAENELYEKFKIGVALNMLGQYNEAAEDLKLALDHFDSSKEMDNTYAIDTELSSVYEHEGDYKQAYYYLDRAGVYKDSLDKRNRNEMMANMLAKYDAAKKDKAFILLNERQAATQHRLARTRVITILSLGLLAVIIILAITLVNRYRIKQRLRQMEMRNQLASDLHDDIGGSLSSILLLSKMASQNIPANSGNAALINKISTNSKEVMERMSDIVWATNPKFDSGTNLKERLENYIIQVRQMSHLDVTANISDDISEIKFPVLMRKNIYLVCKEAVNNILKHAEATELIIEIGVDHKMLTMLIKDNGKGFDTSRSFQGIGLETMVLRVKACEGELDMQSCPGKGTTISILIPVPHSRYFA